jgi:RNA methyltransferase, TrmH family
VWVVELIDSKNNPIVKETLKLKEKKHRVDRMEFIVEGYRFAMEAIASSFEVKYLFLSEEHAASFIKLGILNNLKPATRVLTLTNKLFKSLSSTENPQGILAVVKLERVIPKETNGFYVLTDKIQDPGNMGTIIRTAHAAGSLGVITTKGTVDVYNEKTLRSTMGSIFKVPILEDNDLSLVKNLQGKGYKLVVTSLQAKEAIYGKDLTGKVIIAVGNEGNGISEEVLSLADERVKLPMPGDAESLNAAVAVSIVIYEIVRQRWQLRIRN